MALDFTVMDASVKVSTTWNAQQEISGLTASPNIAQGSYDTQVEMTVGTGSGSISNPLVTVEEIAANSSGTIDLFALVAPPSNLNLDLSYASIRIMVVELIANDDDSTGSLGIRIGPGVSNPFEGWLNPGGWNDVDQNGLPYVAGGPSGRVVDATHRNFLIANRDPSNMATVRISIFGVKVGA